MSKKSKKPYVAIEDDMPWNPKMRQVSVGARWAHVAAICYSGHNLTDGFIAAPVLSLIDATRRIAAELVAADLWESVDGGFLVHDYLDYNRSRAEVDAIRERNTVAGERGRAARYGLQDGTENAGTAPAKTLAKGWQGASEKASAMPAMISASASSSDPLPLSGKKRSVAATTNSAGKVPGIVPAVAESELSEFESDVDVGFRERYAMLAMEFREVDGSMARKFRLLAEDWTQEDLTWALNELSRRNTRPWPEKVTAVLLEREANETEDAELAKWRNALA